MTEGQALGLLTGALGATATCIGYHPYLPERRSVMSRRLRQNPWAGQRYTTGPFSKLKCSNFGKGEGKHGFTSHTFLLHKNLPNHVSEA